MADVLMELKFSNIFSINTSGIYQRLAIGKTAVSQQGAAYMFARDQKGNLDPETAKAIASIESIKGRSTEFREKMSKIMALYREYESDSEKNKKSRTLFCRLHLRILYLFAKQRMKIYLYQNLMKF